MSGKDTSETGERVLLRHGSEVLVRPIRPEDKDLLTALVAGLSEESRYRRFLAPITHLSDRQLVQFTELDHHASEALIALDAEEAECVGIVRYMPYAAQKRAAEIATVIADTWQGRGLGRVLVERLVARARAEGIERLIASIRTDNRPALRLFELLGFERARRIERKLIELEIKLREQTPGADELPSRET